MAGGLVLRRSGRFLWRHDSQSDRAVRGGEHKHIGHHVPLSSSLYSRTDWNYVAGQCVSCAGGGKLEKAPSHLGRLSELIGLLFPHRPPMRTH